MDRANSEKTHKEKTLENREYCSQNALFIVAAFVEAHEDLFLQWMKDNHIDPDDGMRHWQQGIAQKHAAIQGLVRLNLKLRDRQTSELCTPHQSRRPKE